jgi:hypothetical protein
MRHSFDPTIWGPHAWFFLETITLGYPTNPTEKEKSNTKNFFYALQFVIPCEKCRVNYSEHLHKYPLSNNVLENRDNLFNWIVNIHNSVDPNKIISHKETYDYYNSKFEGDDEKKVKFRNKKIKNTLIIFMMILIIIIMYKIYLYFIS